MNIKVFLDSVHRFDAYFGNTSSRKVLLLLDNCSAHGEIDQLPALSDVDVIFAAEYNISDSAHGRRCYCFH